MAMAEMMLQEASETIVIADRGYDADSLVTSLRDRGCKVVIPPRSNRKCRRRYDRKLYGQRFRVECFFQRLKRFRRIGTRYDKRALHFLGMILIAAILLWIF
jgi:putative transposase